MMQSHCPSPAWCVFATALLVGCQRGPASEPDGSRLPPEPASVTPANVTDPPLLMVTPKAAAMVRQYASNAPGAGALHLRVRVVPGGCQGFMHKLDLDPAVSAEDHAFDSGGVRIVVAQRQAEMLRGTQVDYGEEDGRMGFKVDNPNFKGDWAKKWLLVLENEKDIK